MRRALLLLLLFLSPPAPAGIFGGRPPVRIPKPRAEFAATVVDHGGTSVRIASVTWNGEVHIWGKLGAAEVTIPFENVRTARVLPAEDPDLRVVVVATSHGEDVRILVDDDLPVYGRTPFGNYRILLRDIRELRFSR